MRSTTWPFANAATFVAVLALVLTSCGSDGGAGDPPTNDRPTVVVTTNILGDVVDNLVGKHVDVVTIMPVGADPHDFQASAQQVALLTDADLVVANGGGFEEGLVDILESVEADGATVVEAITLVDTIDFRGEGDHDGADDDDDHGDEGIDPHFFTDPARMAVAAAGIVDAVVATVEGVDKTALVADAEPYIEMLRTLDEQVEDLLASVPSEQRVLVTNHDVFGHFADRYRFEVAGTVIPGGTTVDAASAAALAALAQLVEAEGVPAVFADASSSDELARTLAAEVGDVAVVPLFSESLGDADSAGATYLDMVRTNAERIAMALSR